MSMIIENKRTKKQFKVIQYFNGCEDKDFYKEHEMLLLNIDDKSFDLITVFNLINNYCFVESEGGILEKQMRESMKNYVNRIEEFKT